MTAPTEQQQRDWLEAVARSRLAFDAAIAAPDPLSLPGYELAATPEPVAKLIAELQQRATEVASARQAVTEAETKVKSERDADTLAGARALREGKQPSAPKALRQAEADLDDRKRDLAQQTAAQSSAQAELKASLAKYGEDWRSELARQREACTTRIEELVTAIEEEADLRRQLDAARSWSEDAVWRPLSPIDGAVLEPLRQWIRPTESLFTGQR